MSCKWHHIYGIRIWKRKYKRLISKVYLKNIHSHEKLISLQHLLNTCTTTWHLIQHHSLLLFCYKMETYLLCSSPCSPEGTVKHSSMWPCNNLRTSPPIRYPWIKGENQVHFSEHSNTQNYSSNCNKYYQVDFRFFSVWHFILLWKKESEEGEDLIDLGGSWILPS